jgi:capsular exopolysaccharide synthesis family protein
MVQEEEPAGWSLHEFFTLLRRRRWMIALVVVVVAGGALGVSLLQRPVYEASALLLIEEPATASNTVLNPSDGQQETSGTLVVQTQMQIITSQPVIDAVTKQLGRDSSGVTVSEVGQTLVVRVTASSTSPSHAAAVANAYANQYITFTRGQDINSDIAAATQLKTQIDNLQTKINGIDAQVAAASGPNQATVQANLGPQRDNLVTQQGLFTEQLQQLEVEQSLRTGAAELVTPAAVPSAPVSPKPIRNAILGILAGLLLGVAAAYGFDYLDDSVKSVEDVANATRGLPNLGLIPQVSNWKETNETMVVSVTDPTSPTSEAYRTLRTSIQFVRLDHEARIIQVTSPSAAEGKTTTLANLGVALAQAGQRVCLCCCDLRRPRVHEFFGLDNEIGLTSTILGQHSLSSAIQDVPGIDGLRVLASGPLPPNPSELLGSPRAAEVIKTLAASFDTVLVDSPPVLPVTDAAVLSGVVDATLLTVSAGDTTTREIARALQILNQVHAPLIGTVINGVTSQTGGGYYIYGRNRYYRYEQAQRTSARKARTPGGEPPDGDQPKEMEAQGALPS